VPEELATMQAKYFEKGKKILFCGGRIIDT
jgi:hypothetical protein